ncbi:hypothetical protein SAMN06265368_1082 [Cohaesibacter gelatinilyticus]|uniref:Cell pole-organizing protein PopZ n=2 Tax=Cohaesibacter gelatinilyticus TaxID=372072 RepID=A0A285NDM3_9HYPH|nr:hypothetical protein SAMN06265368_1082 [Cohaesibacter gelatinilyticus]
MEEILASIRRIISDEEAAIGGDETPEPEVAAEPEVDPNAEMGQDDLDALFDAPAPVEEEPAEEEDDMAAMMAAMETDSAEGEVEEEEEVLDLPTEWQEQDLVQPHDDDLMFMEEQEEEPAPETVAEATPEPIAEPDPTPELEQMVQSTLEEKVPSLLKATIETEPTPLDNLPDVEKGMPLVSNQTSEVVTNAFENLTHTILSNNTRTMENVVEDMLRPMLKAWLDQNLPVMVERLVRAEIERVSRGEQHYR